PYKKWHAAKTGFLSQIENRKTARQSEPLPHRSTHTKVVHESSRTLQIKIKGVFERGIISLGQVGRIGLPIGAGEGDRIFCERGHIAHIDDKAAMGLEEAPDLKQGIPIPHGMDGFIYLVHCNNIRLTAVCFNVDDLLSLADNDTVFCLDGDWLRLHLDLIEGFFHIA